MKIDCKEYQLRLRDPFTIARGTTTVQPTLIVRVQYDGLVGYGEATTNDYYGVTLERMTIALRSVSDQLTGYRLENPAELWRELDPSLSATDSPSARSIALYGISSPKCIDARFGTLGFAIG